MPIKVTSLKLGCYEREIRDADLNRKSFTDKSIRGKRTDCERNHDVQEDFDLDDTKHALNGNSRASGKIRIHGDLMNVVA